MYVSCSLDDTCWERAEVLALLHVMFSCVFATFPYAVLSQVWYMIVSFLIFGFFLALSFEKLFERKSDLVRTDVGNRIFTDDQCKENKGVRLKS